MSVLFFGIGLFLTAFFIHLFVWRIHLPKNHTKSLLGIFIGMLVCGILMLWWLEKNDCLSGMFSFSVGYGYLRLSFLYISLMLAYVVTYSAIEVDSPSLSISAIIGKAGPRGVSREDLDRIMTDDILVKPRVSDLVSVGIARLDKDRYKLTAKGAIIARLFIFYRGLLGVSKGG